MFSENYDIVQILIVGAVKDIKKNRFKLCTIPYMIHPIIVDDLSTFSTIKDLSRDRYYTVKLSCYLDNEDSLLYQKIEDFIDDINPPPYIQFVKKTEKFQVYEKKSKFSCYITKCGTSIYIQDSNSKIELYRDYKCKVRYNGSIYLIFANDLFIV